MGADSTVDSSVVCEQADLRGYVCGESVDINKKEEWAKDGTLRNPGSYRNFRRVISIQHHGLTSPNKKRAGPVQNLVGDTIFLQLIE